MIKSIICPVCNTVFSANVQSNNANTQPNSNPCGCGCGGSGNGVGAPVTQKRNRAEERLETLRNAGIDTSEFVAMAGASGDGFLFRLKNGVPEFVADDDPIFDSIKKDGFIPDRRLFRRWILSQMFHAENDKYAWRGKGLTSYVRSHGYEYMWRVLVEEFKAQSRLEGVDNERLGERNLWYNRQLLEEVAADYIQILRNYIKGLKIRHCKGVEYKRIKQLGDIFVSDIETKVFNPIRGAYSRIRLAKNAKELYQAILAFNKVRVRMSWNTKMPQSFVDAYKGTGAYFALQNLIRFHGVKFCNEDGAFFDSQDAEKALRMTALAYANEHAGYKLYARFKLVLEKNHFDIEAKQKEWAIAKRNR